MNLNHLSPGFRRTGGMVAFATLFLSTLLHAGPYSIWTAPLKREQGSYNVAMNSICAVALERYTLRYHEKMYPVTECTIETIGGRSARFYYIGNEEKKKKKDDSLAGEIKEEVDQVSEVLIAKEALDNEAKGKVIKEQEQAAASRTSEYAFEHEGDVVNLYEDLMKKWLDSNP